MREPLPRPGIDSGLPTPITPSESRTIKLSELTPATELIAGTEITGVTGIDDLRTLGQIIEEGLKLSSRLQGRTGHAPYYLQTTGGLNDIIERQHRERKPHPFFRSARDYKVTVLPSDLKSFKGTPASPEDVVVLQIERILPSDAGNTQMTGVISIYPIRTSHEGQYKFYYNGQVLNQSDANLYLLRAHSATVDALRRAGSAGLPSTGKVNKTK